MKYETIGVDKRDGVATVTLNRPERLNAINAAMQRELLDAIADIRDDDTVSVAIITGAGRAFCSGRDLKDIGQGTPLGTPSGPGEPWKPIEDMDKPVIAAVNGACYTGGMTLIECCDIVLASDAAVFCDTHARFGMPGGGGELTRLPRMIGLQKAKEVLFTCEPFSAQEAERIGLVTRVVPAGKLMEAANELARKISRNNRFAIQTQKRVLNRGFRVGLVEAFEIELHEGEAYQRAHHDAQERARGFVEKKDRN